MSDTAIGLLLIWGWSVAIVALARNLFLERKVRRVERQPKETRVDQLCAAVESDFVEGPMLDARNVDGSIGIKIGALEVWETPDEAREFAERILKAVEGEKA